MDEQAIKETLDLRILLSKLRASAEPKRWRDEPNGVAMSCGYLFSCCWENGFLVLGVSLEGRELTVTAQKLVDVIVAVFGEPQKTVEASYPKRGLTTLFFWSPRG